MTISVMLERATITRDAIVQSIVTSLRPLNYVHAFWEGGSVAFGRADRWSDLDLYALVDESKVPNTFRAIERSLRTLSPISQTYLVEGGYEGVSQKFYRLRDADEFAVIDLGILTPKSLEKFLTPEIHGTNVFYFNKRGVAKVTPLDEVSFNRKRWKKLHTLNLKFAMFNNYVIKEIERGHSLEALEDYRVITLGILVEALRIRFSPLHFDFRMHYVDRELPADAVKRLKRLSYVRDVKDLEKKYKEATDWCIETLDSAARMGRKEGMMQNVTQNTLIKRR